MRRVGLIVSGVAMVFSLGFFYASSDDIDESQPTRHWRASQVHEPRDRDNLMENISASGHWVVRSSAENPSGPTGRFDEDYSVIAIVQKKSESYALLKEKHAQEMIVHRVSKGDIVGGGWLVTDIFSAEVVANNNDEVQRVEMFSTD